MQFIEKTFSPNKGTLEGVRKQGGQDQESCSTILGGRPSRRSSILTHGGIMQRFLIALLLCLGLSSIAANADAQIIKDVAGYLLPGQTNVFYSRVPGNTASDTIYRISGVYSVSGTLIIQEGAEVDFMPNARVVDSTNGKIIANGFTGLQRRILFRAGPVDANSFEWGHFLILPGADSTFFANVRFVNFRKLWTVDRMYFYGVLANGPNYAQAIEAVSNGGGAVLTTFSKKTYIYDAIVDSCLALYHGGAFSFVQAPAASYHPEDDGRFCLANSQVRRLLIRDTHVVDNDATAGNQGSVNNPWSVTASSALGGAIYMSARLGATTADYLTAYLGNRPGPFFPATQDTMLFERCGANNNVSATGETAHGGAIYVGPYTGLILSQASFNNDSATATQTSSYGPDYYAYGGAIGVSGTSGSPFQVPPPSATPGADHLPGLAILKRANFNNCFAGFGGAVHMDLASSLNPPILNIDAENFNAFGVRDSGYIFFNSNVGLYEGGAIYTSWYTFVKGYLAPSTGVYDPINQVQVPANQVELRVKFFNNVAGMGGGSIYLDAALNNSAPAIQNRRVWHLANSVNAYDPRINLPGLVAFAVGGGAEFVGLSDSTFAGLYQNNFTVGGNGGAVNMTGPQGNISAPVNSYNRYFCWDKYNVNSPTTDPLPFDQRELTMFVNNQASLGHSSDSVGDYNIAGRGGAIYINVTNKNNNPIVEDSAFFVRVRIEQNTAWTGSAIFSDNYNLRLVTDLTLIANNMATSPIGHDTDLTALLGGPGNSNVSATIWGEFEGPLPGFESNSRGDAVYDNTARYIVRLPSSPGVGFGGADTLRGNFWGDTGPDIITRLPSGALQRTFFLDYYAGCVGTTPQQTYEVYEANRTPQHAYIAIPVGTIPDTLLMEGRVYDIFDRGTDIKTTDYSVRRLAITEDFALAEPTDIGFGNSNPALDHHGLHRFTRNFYDTNATYVNTIMAGQTEFIGPHPLGYPLFLEADVDTNDVNRDTYAKNYSVLYVINTNTNEFVRVNAKEIVQDEATGQIAKYRARLDFVPDSSLATRNPLGRANILWTLSLLRPLTSPPTFFELQRAAKLEDSAALAGRIYNLDFAQYRGTGADSVATSGNNMSKVTWYAGERYHTLPVRPGDNIVVISRTQLWKYGSAGAIARGLQFPIGDVLPPQFTSDIVNLQNDPVNPNNLFLREDVNYDGVNKILFRVAGYDINDFYNPAYFFDPAHFTQLQFQLSGYKTLADSNNTRIAWWLHDTTIFNANVTGSNGYVLLKGQPHNPDVVPGGEQVTATITNYPPNYNSEHQILGHGFALGADSLNLSMWSFPPYMNCPGMYAGDTLAVRSTSTTYKFRIFVQDSVPVFLNSLASTDCYTTSANLTDKLRFSYDWNTDDELEDSTAAGVTTAWAAQGGGRKAFAFQFGRTAYSSIVSPDWLQYAINIDSAHQAVFARSGIVNVSIDSATAIGLITPTPQVNGELNLDTIVTVRVDDGHTGVAQQKAVLHVNIAPVILTDTLVWAKEGIDYANNYKDPTNIPYIQITDANFSDFHTFQLIYKGTTDTVYRDQHYKAGQAILVGTTPLWLKIDVNSGTLYGTPGITDAPHKVGGGCNGPDTVLVLVTDCGGLTAWKSFPLNVDSTDHSPRFERGPRTFCVLNKQAFCDTVQVSDLDLLRLGCATDTLTIQSLDTNFTVKPTIIGGVRTNDTAYVAVCGTFNFDDTYFSQNPPPAEYIRLKVTDKDGNWDTVSYRIYVGDIPTFECAVYVSNIGTSTHPTDIQRLCFGAGRFGTDSLDIRYCEFEIPPPGPSAVFDARWELPIGGSIKGTYLDIRRDTAQYSEVVWQIRFQSGADGGTFLYPVNIAWRPSCLDSTGSMVGDFYLQNPFNVNEFSINMRTGLGIWAPAFYTLTRVGSDSLIFTIRNVGLSNARIVFHPLKESVEAIAPASEFALKQNFPNPFTPSTGATTLSFAVAKKANVRIEVYDLKGALVRTLVNEQLEPGTYPVAWDGMDAAGAQLPSGTYVARMSAGTYSSMIKMTLKK